MNTLIPISFAQPGSAEFPDKLMTAIAAFSWVTQRLGESQSESERLVVSALPDGPSADVEVNCATGSVKFQDGMVAVLINSGQAVTARLGFTVNGRLVPVSVRHSLGKVIVSIWGDEVVFAVRSSRMAELALIRPPPPLQVGTEILYAPLPGLLMSVLAAEGMRVIKGETVAVLEAMKMENSLTIPMDAVVTRILVAEGTLVAAHAQILEYRPCKSSERAY